MRPMILALALIASLLPEVHTSRADDADPRRPVYHFTPLRNFINDPNGLVFSGGEYHLFYQHNPEGDRWGHMSWGHAVSRDLMRWEHLPLALREEAGIMIFSGSAVDDARNTSGLGRPGSPAMVAIYTGDGHGRQTQNLASSVDAGRTWAKFAGNPVVDIGSNSFRDPKVFWHATTGRWIMATVLADDRKVRFWGSADLKRWENLSDFGPAGSTEGVWECPELFEAPVEGGGLEESRWVLKVDVGGGAPNGGSGGQYFVGQFDGSKFRPENPESNSPPLWIDGGKDFYASQAWNGATEGRRPIWIGWMNNWQYANEIPTSPWRGAMTIPRSVALRKADGGFRLIQSPVEGLKSLRRGHSSLPARQVPAGEIRLDLDGIPGNALEIIAEFEPHDAAEFGLKVRRGRLEETLVGVDRKSETVFVDRSRSGAVAFSPHFAGRHSRRLSLGSGLIRLHVLVDATSVEVFTDGGLAVLTDQIFPDPASRGVSVYSAGGTARLVSLEVMELRP